MKKPVNRPPGGARKRRPPARADSGEVPPKVNVARSAAAGFGVAKPGAALPAVSVRRSARRERTVTAYRERDTIVVLVPHHLSKTDEVAVVDDMVRRVLAKEARATAPRGECELLARANGLAERHLAPAVDHLPSPSEVSWVSNQQRRWGSCTPSTRTIRLSDRLRPMPSWVVDYVLLHELVHLVEPSHSAGFWRLVDRYPQAEKAKGFLEGYQLGVGQPPVGSDDVD